MIMIEIDGHTVFDVSYIIIYCVGYEREDDK